MLFRGLLGFYGVAHGPETGSPTQQVDLDRDRTGVLLNRCWHHVFGWDRRIVSVVLCVTRLRYV